MGTYTAINPNTSTQVDYAIPELWAKELLAEAEKQMFWKNYEGAQGSGMPVIRKDDLTKQAGDRIHIQTISNLTGTGVTGTSTLIGNEELLSLGQISVVPNWLRHAVGVNKDAEVKANFDIRNTAKQRLSYWLSDKMDQAMFTTATTSPTYTIYAGDATSTATLGSGDELDCLAIDKIKYELENNKALPIKTENGNEYFILVISPADAYYLRQDSTWNQAQRDANIRGETNPIFSGAMGVYNGVIVRKSHNVPVSSSKSKCVAFGGEAFARGYSYTPDWNEEEQDYGFIFGVATKVCYGDARAVEVNTAVVECYAAAPVS